MCYQNCISCQKQILKLTTEFDKDGHKMFYKFLMVAVNNIIYDVACFLSFFDLLEIFIYLQRYNWWQKVVNIFMLIMISGRFLPIH